MILNVSNKKALYHFLQPQFNTKKVLKRQEKVQFMTIYDNL